MFVIVELELVEPLAVLLKVELALDDDDDVLV